MTEFEQAVLDRLDRIATLLAGPVPAPAPAPSAAYSCGMCHRWVPYGEYHVCAASYTADGQ